MELSEAILGEDDGADSVDCGLSCLGMSDGIRGRWIESAEVD